MTYSVHLVAHTHWDREWYQPLVRFRQRLVALVDELLDEPPPEGESFLLDGQAIVLEDYLAVRPERAAELSALLQRGRLEAGPWYVLPDELIPGGESLVRNLLVGRRVLRALRADPPPVLYCPDSFGHPAALPALARGFDFSLIVLWRGFGGRRWPAGDVFEWEAPDGARAIVFHLARDGYEYGSHLPSDPEAAQQRWNRMRSELGLRSSTGVLLIQNGADHHARQLDQRQAFAALAAAAAESGDQARGSSLRAFSADLLRRTRQTAFSEVSGELRDSYGYTWTLQGTLASRAGQKRRAALAERVLLRDAEPWSAIARRRGGPSRVPLLVAAWKSLLQAHPHDTLCGCSIDDVAEAMDRRVAEALAQGAGIRDDALADVIGHDPVAARTARDQWSPLVIVRNRSTRIRGGVALVDVREFVADVPVGPGSAPSRPEDTRATAKSSPILGVTSQLLQRRTDNDRIESPRHYPDNDLVTISRLAIWLDSVPAYGIMALPIGVAADQRPSSEITNPVRADDAAIDNALLRITVDADGVVSLTDIARRCDIPSLLIIQDERDLGDLYTPSIRGAAAIAQFVGARVTYKGPLIGQLETRWRLLEAKAREGKRQRVVSELHVQFILQANAPFVRLRIAGRNLQPDHRLRIGLRTLIESPKVWADAAFGPVRRKPLTLPEKDSRMERAPRTAPLHRYVSLFSGKAGATVYSDGLAEYEATTEGSVFVTLVRAVGELSRNNLPERPGHAGWPAHTPNAQSLGPFEAQLALMLHGGRAPTTIDDIERVADEVLLPLEGHTLRSALTVPPPSVGAQLQGECLAFSAIKESEDGAWLVVRCVNLVEHDVHGSWRFGVPIAEAHLARLDETVIEPLVVHENSVSFQAGPRAIVTILVR